MKSSARGPALAVLATGGVALIAGLMWFEPRPQPRNGDGPKDATAGAGPVALALEPLAPAPAGAAPAPLSRATSDPPPTAAERSLSAARPDDGLPPLPTTAQSVHGWVSGGLPGEPIELWIEQAGTVTRGAPADDGRFVLQPRRPLERAFLVARSGDLTARSGPFDLERGERRNMGRLTLGSERPISIEAALDLGIGDAIESLTEAAQPLVLDCLLLAPEGKQLPASVRFAGRRFGVDERGRVQLTSAWITLEDPLIRAPGFVPIDLDDDPDIEAHMQLLLMGYETSEPEIFTLQLESAASLTVRVSDPTGRPLAGLGLTLDYAGYSQSDVDFVTDDDGIVSRDDLHPGRAELEWTDLRACAPAPTELRLVADEQLELELNGHSATGTLAGLVRDIHARPLPGAEVRIRPLEPKTQPDGSTVTIRGAAAAITTTDLAGRFEFPTLCAGRWRVELTPPHGFQGLGSRTRTDLDLPPGERTDLDLPLN